MDTLTKLLFLHQNADLDHLQQALKKEDFRAERDQLRAVHRATEELRTLQAVGQVDHQIPQLPPQRWVAMSRRHQHGCHLLSKVSLLALVQASSSCQSRARLMMGLQMSQMKG